MDVMQPVVYVNVVALVCLFAVLYAAGRELRELRRDCKARPRESAR